MWSDEDSRYWQKHIKDGYGVSGTLSRLDGEFDLNLAVHEGGQLRSVFKIMRPGCDAGLVEMQIAALDHLAQANGGIQVPQVVRRLDGTASAVIDDAEGDPETAGCSLPLMG